MTCMIVDDEPLAVKLLESFVGRIPDLELKGSFTDSIEALDVLTREPVDLLFLDIQMPDLNGMELAHVIDNNRTRVIFTTAFKDYAFESYEVNALDFLLKPIRYIKFQASIEKARQYFAMKENAEAAASEKAEPTDKNDVIFLRADGELHQIALARILYVEGMKDYLKFYIEGERKPFITHMTMTAAEEMLPSSGFMRINRSYIVSLSHIRSIDRNDCVYIGEQIIRVTDAYKEQFDQYIAKRTTR
ncbi:MAG: response regulator transcription factor [Bacteroidales bacterium]|nr:response regulator transcription factor [Bacteroidales bacterium]